MKEQWLVVRRYLTERVRMVHKHVGGASSGRQYWKEDWATYARIKKERNANRM